MTQTLKNYFIPHEGNNLRPRFFMWETAVVVFSLILLIELVFLIEIFWVLPRTDYSANILPGVIVNLTNESRGVYAVPELSSNAVLSRAAQLKAEDMAQKGYFSHTSPGGEAPWDFMDRAGYSFVSAGENLAVNFIDSEEVVSAWMQSEAHKANIISGNFTEIGIGIARGVFEGREAVYVVQFFGKPISYQAPAPSKSVPPTPTAPSRQNPPAPVVRPGAEARESSALAEVAEEPKEADPVAKAGEFLTPQALSLAIITEFFSQPHRMVNYLYLVMLTMIALAFSLMIFVRIHIQHPRLILNGAMMLLLLSSLIVFNQYLVMAQIRIL